MRAWSPLLEAHTGPKRHAAMGGRMLPPPQRGAPQQVRGDVTWDTWDAWAYPWDYDPRPHHRQPNLSSLHTFPFAFVCAMQEL